VGGLLEKVALPGGTPDWRHYIQAEGQTVAIVSRLSTGSNTVSYPLEDHEGSSSVLTNSSGGSIVKESFNAFGLPRNGSTWSGAVPSGDKTLINGLTRRGYTFHSMLGDMGLIHMNGRVQDAITGRFLSPDPTIPDPGFTQSFNRYSYVNNNPLSFIDPSGFDDLGTIDVNAKCRGQTDPVWLNKFKTEWDCLPSYIDRNTLCNLAATYHVDIGDTCSGSQGGQQDPGGGSGGGSGGGDGNRDTDIPCLPKTKCRIPEKPKDKVPESLKDISSMLCFADITQPDLPIPDLQDIQVVDMSDMDIGNGVATGRVGKYPWSGVELSNRFLSPLKPLPGMTIPSTRYELFDTIIHETIHTTHNFVSRSMKWDEASTAAEARRRSAPYGDQIRRGVAGRAGCGH
jgi:RHS repeat-associated protein